MNSWTHRDVPAFGTSLNLHPKSLAAYNLIRDALVHGRPWPIEIATGGTCTLTPKEVIEAVSGILGVRVMHHNQGALKLEDAGKGNYLLGNEDTCIAIQISLSGNVSFEVISRVHESIEKLRAWATENLHETPTENGPVMALTRQGDRFTLMQIGTAGCNLERGNYSEKVLADVDFVKGDLVSPSPHGRLTIFSGPPGTGKTHLLQYLLQTPGATFMLCPADYLAALSGPDFIPVLIEARDSRPGPIVILVEDGNEAIVPREGGNMSAITALLGLGDGLQGLLFDTRVIVTSNAPKLTMDKAIQRPGRLCRHIAVEELTPTHSRQVLTRLLGHVPEGWQEKSYPLADLYGIALGNGWSPPKEPTPIGFAMRGRHNKHASLMPPSDY